MGENVGGPTMKVTVEGCIAGAIASTGSNRVPIRTDVFSTDLRVPIFATEFEKHQILHRGSQ